MEKERCEKNALGPFYVEKDSCISCGAPETEAPDLVVYDEEISHCYFTKQPTTEEETSKAIRAIWVSCCGTYRYSGNDSAILKRLSDLGLSDQCDDPTVKPPILVVRNHVTFSFYKDDAKKSYYKEILDYFCSSLINKGLATKIWRSRFCLKKGFSFTWYESTPSMEVQLESLGSQHSWLLHLKGYLSSTEISTAMIFDDLLRDNSHFHNIRWFTEGDWLAGGKVWTKLPF